MEPKVISYVKNRPLRILAVKEASLRKELKHFEIICLTSWLSFFIMRSEDIPPWGLVKLTRFHHQKCVI